MCYSCHFFTIGSHPQWGLLIANKFPVNGTSSNFPWKQGCHYSLPIPVADHCTGVKHTRWSLGSAGPSPDSFDDTSTLLQAPLHKFSVPPNCFSNTLILFHMKIHYYRSRLLYQGVFYKMVTVSPTFLMWLQCVTSVPSPLQLSAQVTKTQQQEMTSKISFIKLKEHRPRFLGTWLLLPGLCAGRKPRGHTGRRCVIFRSPAPAGVIHHPGQMWQQQAFSWFHPPLSCTKWWQVEGRNAVSLSPTLFKFKVHKQKKSVAVSSDDVHCSV